MKRRSLILVGFLVVLSIVAMSFSNVSAIAYDYSPESISEFNETLPDDVLFYPDAIEPQITDGNVSGAETNDYTETFVNDGTTWNNLDTGPDLYTYFDVNGSFPVDTMLLQIDAVASGPISSHTLILYLYNPQGDDLLVASHSGVGAGVDAVLNGWYNVTAWGYYEYDSKHTFYLFTAGSVNPTNILVDYFRLSFMTGASQANPVLSEPYFATGGDTGFGNTYAVDSDNFSLGGSGDAVLEFSYTTSNISSLVSFTYAIYGVSDGTMFVHYFSDETGGGGGGPFDVITSEGWYNGTYNTALGALENTGTGYVQFASNSEASVNYMEISFTYIPVSSYGESFSDVSDWTEETGTISSDTDTATIQPTVPWPSGWSKRKDVTLTGASGAGTNYQIQLNVPYDDDMQIDFDDLIFYDNDEVTLLDYWRESYIASTSAVFWVEVKDNLDSNVDIFMYYGNDAVSTSSNGEATFLLFDDFEDNNLDNWATTSNIEISSARVHGGSYSASWTSSASNALMQDNTYNGLSGIRISFWNNVQDTERGSFIYVYSEADYSEQVATIRSGYETDTSEIYYRDTGVYVSYPDSADDLNDDEWDKIEFSVDFDADKMQTWQNGVANGILAIVDDDGSELETEEVDGMGLMMQSTNQAWFDDVIVRKWVDSGPEFDSWGDEETAPSSRSYVSFSSTDYFEYYYEFYVTSTTGTYNFQFYYSSSWVNVTTSSNTTGTISGFMNDDNAATVTRFGFLVSGDDNIVLDYLRVSLSTERGFAHDGSTTVGITSADGGSISSDNDYISLTADSDGSTFNITTDTTATLAPIATVYYPMVAFWFHSGDSADYIKIEAFNGTEFSTLIENGTVGTNPKRVNLAVVYSVVTLFRFSVYSSATIRLDYLKVHSIANYTLYFQAGVETGDYAYVENNTLQVSKATAKYIKFSHDPTLAVSISSFNLWEYSSTDINPTESTDINVQFYIDGGWGGLTADTSTGELSGTTLTDIQFFVYSTLDISAITFYGVVPAWNIITTVEIEFWVAGWQIISSILIVFATEIATYSLNLLLLFLGLAMIPLSTVYLVHGGRSEMSMDKIFYGVVVFIFGWALFLGGIFV